MNQKRSSQGGTMSRKDRKLGIGATLIVAAFSSLTACGAGRDSLEVRSAIEMRVSELEHANQQLQVRLDAYETSITLVEDEVESLRVVDRTRANLDNLEVVRLEPEMTYRPKKYADDVQSNSDSEPAEYVDIVVSDDKMNKYFGSPVGDTTPVNTVALRPKSPPVKRTPQEPVVMDEKLPVLAMDKSGEAVAAVEDPVDYYKAGLKHYRQQEFEPAIQLFETFLDATPPTDYVDNALYWLGECYYGLGRYNDAARYFHRIVKEFPDGNKVPDALLKVGLTYIRLEKPESAREVMYYLIEAYPKSDAAHVAQERLESLNAT
ncbi:MAG: tol-pal system protein YbgF [Deltaproteobacteria bacterium CG_4_9_14_3_um_filter_63_12]|nr:MAG: tol-pal system protein YbgF [Deltaproteobacteria bacterium CG_4_9_14_3_um_filter_63_12]